MCEIAVATESRAALSGMNSRVASIEETASEWLHNAGAFIDTKSSDATSVLSYFKRPRMGMILIPTFIFYLSVFISIPIISQVVIQLICDERNDHNNDDDCTSSDVSKHAAMVTLYLQFSSYLPAFLVAGFYGLMADRIGRKLVMLIPLVGYFIYLCCFVGVAYFKPSLWRYILTVGCFIFGSSGGYSTFSMAVFSYVSDLTASKQLSARSYCFAIIEAAILLSGMLTFVGGVWAANRGFVEPLLFSLLNTLVCILYVIFFLKESFPSKLRQIKKDQQQLDGIAKSNFLTSITATFTNVYWLLSLKGNSSSSLAISDTSSDFGASKKTLPAVYALIAYFLYALSSFAGNTISVFYLIHKFSWDSDIIGYFLSLTALFNVLSMVILPELIKYLRNGKSIHDVYWILLGYIAYVIYYVLFPFQNSLNSIFSLTILILLTGSVTPRSRSLIANSVSNAHQAKSLSAFSAGQSLSLLLSPIFDALYSSTIDVYAGTTYFVFALFCLISTFLILYVLLDPVMFRLLPRETSKSDAGGTRTSEDGIDDPLLTKDTVMDHVVT